MAIEYYKISDLARLLAGKSSFNLVAGVRLEALQNFFATPEDFILDRKKCLPVAA